MLSKSHRNNRPSIFSSALLPSHVEHEHKSEDFFWQNLKTELMKKTWSWLFVCLFVGWLALMKPEKSWILNKFPAFVLMKSSSCGNYTRLQLTLGGVLSWMTLRRKTSAIFLNIVLRFNVRIIVLRWRCRGASCSSFNFNYKTSNMRDNDKVQSKCKL